MVSNETLIPVSSPMSLAEIDDYASRVLKLYFDSIDKQEEFPVDIFGVAEKLGGKIEYLDNGLESMEVRKKKDFTIYIPQFTHPRRDRFTIAHEIGHYLLHYPWGESDKEELKVKFWRHNGNLLEYQANRFAAAILMPKEEFKDIYNNMDLGEISEYFNTSKAAVEVRAKVLGLK